MTKLLNLCEPYKTKNGMYVFIVQYHKDDTYPYLGFCIDRNYDKSFVCRWNRQGEIKYTHYPYKDTDMNITMPKPKEYWAWEYEDGKLSTLLYEDKVRLLFEYAKEKGKPIKLVKENKDD